MQVTDQNNGADPAPSRVTAVILAAGRSTRMAPVNKLTADYQGTALVRHAAEAALASRVGEVIVVVGHEAEAVREVLSGLDVAVILLGDMPGVTAAVVDALIGAFEKTGRSKICQPRYDGRPGNPVLWPSPLFPEFETLSGDIGAKPLLVRHKADVLGVDVGTDAIHMDIDAPTDLGA